MRRVKTANGNRDFIARRRITTSTVITGGRALPVQAVPAAQNYVIDLANLWSRPRPPTG